VTIIDIINLISSISSLVLSLLAIWLSLYFYNKSKTTEKDVGQALASIQSQTDALQKLTGRWMDRLTRYATESHPHGEETITQLISFVREYPTQYVAALNISQTNEQIERLTNETITLYIALHYYIAQVNFFTQGHLPKLEDFDSTSEGHNLVKNVLDISQSDFQRLSDIIAQIDNGRLQSNGLHDLYQKTETFWKQFVKSSTEAFQSKEVA
jgi:hypothetical protein